MKRSLVFIGLFATIVVVEADAGLVAHYKFDGNLNDSVGSAHAEMVGAPTFVASPLGQGLLTSTGNYARVPASRAFVPGTSSFSLAAWFKMDGPHPWSNWAPIVAMQGDDFSEGAMISVSRDPQANGSLGLLLHDGSRFQEVRGNSPNPIFGRWHHSAYVVDRANGRVSTYLDGVLLASAPLTVIGSIDPTFDMLIGQYDYTFARNGAPRFVGGQNAIIDDVRIYNNPLTDAQVSQLATIVPEPSTLAALAMGAVGLGRMLRRGK